MVRQWTDLCQDCPWATPFQTPAFVFTWYRVYRSAYAPVLVLGWDNAGCLQGALPLAYSSQRRLVVAGACNAEYQTWISPPHLGDVFPVAAFAAVRRAFSGKSLTFRYVPVGAPLNWLEDPAIKPLRLLAGQPRPILRLGDGSDITQSLRKPANRARLRHLEREGTVEFIRINDSSGLRAALDAMIPWYDARRMALNGFAPFADDPFKRSFHLAKMAQHGLLHVTALKVGGELASVQINVCHKKELQLCLIGHNPTFSRYSPGKLHIHLLCKMLLEAGYQQLDLTPGSDGYKERFANAWDQVHTLNLLPNRTARLVAGLRAGIENVLRGLLKLAAVTPSQVMNFVDDQQRLPLWLGRSVVIGFRKCLGCRHKVRIYSCRAAMTPRAITEPPMRRDAMEHLLAYHRTLTGPSRRQFLSAAIRRLENGQHIYSKIREGRLCQWLWCAEVSPQGNLKKWLPGCELPSGSLVLFDMHRRPLTYAPCDLAADLHCVLDDVAARWPDRCIYVAADQRDLAMTHASEQIGLAYERSAFNV